MSISCQWPLVLILKIDLITVSESQLFFVIFALCHINHDKSFKETITVIRSLGNSMKVHCFVDIDSNCVFFIYLEIILIM